MERLGRLLAASALVCVSVAARAEEPALPAAQAAAPGPVAPALKLQSGDVTLGDGLARLHVPDGFGYLDPAQAKTLLVELWGNPEDEADTLGMLVPTGVDPASDEGWGVVLDYQADGHVNDEDAAEIDYADLLQQIQKDAEESNDDRVKAGYDEVHIVGWAQQPHYDAAAKKLYWAKELRFGDREAHTLNYDIRVLGSDGVLVMSAVSSMEQLPQIEKQMQAVLPHVTFLPGNRYEDFHPDTGRWAGYGIAGLVAGKAAAKVGFFKGLIALLLAGKKLVVTGVVAVGAGLTRLFRRKSA